MRQRSSNLIFFAGKQKEEIEGLLVWQGPVQASSLSEFFDVEVSGHAAHLKRHSILIEGDVSRVKRIGQGMKAGRIEIHGSAGMHLGAEMAGGSILVKGDAGSWAAREMKGGLLHIAGNAGDHVGSAYRGSWRGMTGGQIMIDGNARSQLGGGLAGGQIVVARQCRELLRHSSERRAHPGQRRSAVRGVGAEMNGGTIAVCGEIKQFSPGFVETGREENPKLGDVQLRGMVCQVHWRLCPQQESQGICSTAGRSRRCRQCSISLILSGVERV